MKKWSFITILSVFSYSCNFVLFAPKKDVIKREIGYLILKNNEKSVFIPLKSDTSLSLEDNLFTAKKPRGVYLPFIPEKEKHYLKECGTKINSKDDFIIAIEIQYLIRPSKYKTNNDKNFIYHSSMIFLGNREFWYQVKYVNGLIYYSSRPIYVKNSPCMVD